MTPGRLVDTNFIIRHLVNDQPVHARIAKAFFAACDRGEIDALIPTPVLAECVFVLESFYKFPRPAIATALSQLITSTGVSVDDESVCLDALGRYARTDFSFADCFLAASARATGSLIATFDADFYQFGDVTIKVD